MNDDHDEMVQNWIDECAANGWDINGVPLNSDSKPSPWVAEEAPKLGFPGRPKNKACDRERLSVLACDTSSEECSPAQRQGVKNG